MFDEEHSLLVPHYLILDVEPLVVDMKIVLYEYELHILLKYCHIFRAPINQNVHSCFENDKWADKNQQI